MNLICEKCGTSFQNNKKRKNCFNCIPKKKRYSSDEERIEARKKRTCKNVQNKRKRTKEKAIEYKGGKCEICGYNKCIGALEFHHINSEDKDFGIASKGYTRSWEKLKEELDKCIMVCANCHRELHYS